MALDFPSNPTDGQVYNDFIWNQAKGVWQSKASNGTVSTVSSSAPTTANPGDVWFNSNDASVFNYFDDGTSKQWVEMISSGVPATSSIMPTASIVQTPLSAAPNGWLLCQGQAVSRTTYATLFSAIGTSYGAGDGSTTFNIPDMQGRTTVGKSASGTFSALNNKGGEESHTLTTAELPAHTHPSYLSNNTVSGAGHTHTAGSMRAAIGATGSDANAIGYFASYVDGGATSVGAYTVFGNGGPTSSTRGYNHHTPVFGTSSGDSFYTTVTLTNAANTGGGSAFNVLQPYIVVNYMIKV